jgi:hypothetical protein
VAVVPPSGESGDRIRVDPLALTASGATTGAGAATVAARGAAGAAQGVGTASPGAATQQCHHQHVACSDRRVSGGPQSSG